MTSENTNVTRIPSLFDDMQGAALASLAGLNEAHVRALFTSPHSFFAMCQGLREDESTGYFEPTSFQIAALAYAHKHRWSIYNKFRQAKMTTCIALGIVLRDCMYLHGIQGVVIAHDWGTSEMVFERIMTAYNSLPSSVKMPLSTGKKLGARHIRFRHGGQIKVLTMGARAPAVGHSVDRVHITELGEADNQVAMSINLFPTFNKRTHARVMIESTPGRSGTPHEMIWRKALEGKGRLSPMFLEWWRDPTCAIVPIPLDFQPTIDELSYLHAHPNMTLANLAFRRMALETEFLGDPRLFSAKYPSDPYDGWLGSQNPLMPSDIIKHLLAEALDAKDTRLVESCVHEIVPPSPRSTYLITADPAGFGSSGDPSALTVWDVDARSEVAFWAGREDPGRFAARLMNAQTIYAGNHPLKALVAVESNAAACIATLRERGCSHLLWTNKGHPGWYATAIRLQEAEAHLVRLLRNNEITVRSIGTLQQMLDYDGSRRDQRQSTTSGSHHFDRVRTVVMAADIFTNRSLRVRVTEDAPEARQLGVVSIADLDKMKDQYKQKLNNAFAPASSRFTT